jgi:hypothetical protein
MPITTASAGLRTLFHFLYTNNFCVDGNFPLLITEYQTSWSISNNLDLYSGSAYGFSKSVQANATRPQPFLSKSFPIHTASLYKKKPGDKHWSHEYTFLTEIKTNSNNAIGFHFQHQAAS